MDEILALPWVQRSIFLGGGVVLGVLVERTVLLRLHAFTRKSRFEWDDLVVDVLKGLPTVWLSSAGLYYAANVGELPSVVMRTVDGFLTVVLIGSVAVAGMRLTGGAINMVSARTPDTIRSPTLVVNLARASVGILGAFIILQNLGINITPLITALGIGGLAVALALQDTLGNLFAGVQIILSRQVRPKDYVKLSSGEEGWVTDVKGRNTTIHTFPDGNLVVVPNSVLASSIVKNYSFPQTALWVSIDVGVSYDSDLEHVERVTLEVANAVLEEFDHAVPDQKPLFRYTAFGESSIAFRVRLMVREFRSQGPIRHEFIKLLHRRFNQEGIEIPFPIRTLVIHGGSDGGASKPSDEGAET
jgi:small-conductance mechanosensitive channel